MKTIDILQDFKHVLLKQQKHVELILSEDLDDLNNPTEEMYMSTYYDVPDTE